MLKTLLEGKSAKEKTVIIGLLILVFGLFFLINWIVYKILGFFIGPLFSFGLILIGYYLSLRGVVRMLSFPGITTLMKRTLEFDFCKRTASQVLRNATDLKNSLEFFMGPSVHKDSSSTNLLHLAAQKMVNVIMSLEGQLNVQKESQAIIHQDQHDFMHKLSELKERMKTMIVRY